MGGRVGPGEERLEVAVRLAAGPDPGGDLGAAEGVPYSRSGTIWRSVRDARIRLRIIEVKTVTVVGARSLRTTVSDEWFAGQLPDQDTLSFLDEVGRQAATVVLDVAFPSRMVKLSPMVISRGTNDGVRQGDRYEVQREGEAIHGETGAVIGRLRTRVGLVEVLEAQDNVSVVKSVAGQGFQVRDLAVTSSSREADIQGGAGATGCCGASPSPGASGSPVAADRGWPDSLRLDRGRGAEDHRGVHRPPRCPGTG
jgi:hypothetical protein